MSERFLAIAAALAALAAASAPAHAANAPTPRLLVFAGDAYDNEMGFLALQEATQVESRKLAVDHSRPSLTRTRYIRSRS